MSTNLTTILEPINNHSNHSNNIPIYERLNKTPIGNKRNNIRRSRSKSYDELPIIDPLISAKITKQFEYIQDAYRSIPITNNNSLNNSTSTSNSNRRKSIIRKLSNDDINVGNRIINENETIRSKSTIRSTNIDSNNNKNNNNTTIAPPPNNNNNNNNRPHTQPIPRHTLHRGYSKDDNDIPSNTINTSIIDTNISPQMIPIPPSPLRPVPPPRRIGTENSSRVLKRGMSKDDSDIPTTSSSSSTSPSRRITNKITTTTTTGSSSSSTSTYRSPRKQWITSKNPNQQQQSLSSTTTSTTTTGSNNPTLEPPSLILERPKLYWRQRMSSLFYVFLHNLSPVQSNSVLPDSFTSYYFEIIPTDVDHNYEFERIYVSLSTLIQMKSKEFTAIIEARPRSITSKPYASRDEIERVGKIKQEIKQKMLIETAAEYCVDNLDIVTEESNDNKIHLTLNRYHGKITYFFRFLFNIIIQYYYLILYYL